jgi:hypothetical protein
MKQRTKHKQPRAELRTAVQIGPELEALAARLITRDQWLAALAGHHARVEVVSKRSRMA